jgi:Sortase domain
VRRAPFDSALAATGRMTASTTLASVADSASVPRVAADSGERAFLMRNAPSRTRYYGPLRRPAGGAGLLLEAHPSNRGHNPRAPALAQHMPSVQSHREAGPGIRLTRVMQGSIEWSLLISPIRHAPRYRWAVVFAERTAWAFGLICLRTWGAMYIEGVTGAHRELERFAVLQAAAAQQTAAPDMSLWSRERISAWQRALNEPAPPPLAVLRIPKLRLEVPVLPGTDDFTLNRGVGHIEDTALPGTDGNSGIAGHRDGFLRGLKDVAPDDAIELETLQGKGGLPRRTDLGRRPGGRICAQCDAHAFAHAGHVLSVLPRRAGAPTFHVRAVRADTAVAVSRGR